MMMVSNRFISNASCIPFNSYDGDGLVFFGHLSFGLTLFHSGKIDTTTNSSGSQDLSIGWKYPSLDAQLKQFNIKGT